MPSSDLRLTSSSMRTVLSSSEYSVCRGRCTNGACCGWLESSDIIELYAVQALAGRSPHGPACRRRKGKGAASHHDSRLNAAAARGEVGRRPSRRTNTTRASVPAGRQTHQDRKSVGEGKSTKQ